MSKQSRRNFLKGVGYSTLALAGMHAGSAAAALSPKDHKTLADMTKLHPVTSKPSTSTVKIMGQSLRFIRADRDVMLYLQQPVGEERITLINDNQHPIRLDSKHPLQLKNINGSLVVKLNKSASGTHVLASGDVLILDVKTDSRTVNISSAHPAFKKHFSLVA